MTSTQDHEYLLKYREGPSVQTEVRAAPKGHHPEQREQGTLQHTCASKLRRDQHMLSELLRHTPLHAICIRMEVTPIRQGKGANSWKLPKLGLHLGEFHQEALEEASPSDR